jgi:hypothetical protein
MTRRRAYRARSTAPVYFVAAVLLAAFLCIILPLALTHQL